MKIKRRAHRDAAVNPTVLGVSFKVAAVSPANVKTPLQIVCFFDRRMNSVMKGGAGELDKRLHGLLRAIRRTEEFRGEAFESLLLIPPPRLVQPQRILLFGLGDPRTLSDHQFTRLGSMAVHEATRLGVRAFAFAPDIRDAGVSFRGAEISGLLVVGMIRGLKTLERLRRRKVAAPRLLRRITLLAGHEHYPLAEESVEKTIRRALGRRSQAGAG